jgi:GNAT superfamily N-acetyltransferase
VSQLAENQAISIRQFTPDDVVAAQVLSRAVKWRHRVEDWRFVARVGDGFVAEDATGIIGTALYWKYGRGAGSVGMVIVSPERQRQGIGRKLIEKVLDKLEGSTALLHATPPGEQLCQSLGFAEVGTVRQHQGAAFHPPLISLPPGERLRPLGGNDVTRIINLASRASGLDCNVVMPALLRESSGIALDREGEPIGFALFRRFGDGYVIGPVIAPASTDLSRAKALISHWLSLNAGMFVRVDIPGDTGLSKWLDDLGLPLVDAVVKMSRNGPLLLDPNVTEFAIGNQALCL